MISVSESVTRTLGQDLANQVRGSKDYQASCHSVGAEANGKFLSPESGEWFQWFASSLDIA